MIRCRTYERLEKPALMEDRETGVKLEYKTCYYQDGDMSSPYGYYTGEPMAGILWFLNNTPGVRMTHVAHDKDLIHVYYEDSSCDQRLDSKSALKAVKK